MLLKPEEVAGYCLAIMNQAQTIGSDYHRENVSVDAIVVLTGDGYKRIMEGADLYNTRFGLANFINLGRM